MTRTFLIAALLLAGTARAGEVRMRPGQSLEGVVVPEGSKDYSAHRVDADVFGWNKDYSELACIGMDQYRRPNSEQTGESFLLVFKTDSVEPIHNVHVLFNTAAPNPEDPPPLMDVRDRMWGIDEAFQRLWPKRPKRKRIRGAMKVQMVWDKTPVDENRCEPAVGFVLRWKGQTRFQPHHQLSDIRVACDILRLTNNRTYWGRKDVAAVMPKFEFGSSARNEQSFRYPVSARWDLARSLEMVVRGDGDARAAVARLRRYGTTKTMSGEARAGVLTVAPDLTTLALTLKREIPGIQRVEIRTDESGPDVLLELGSQPLATEEPALASPFEDEDPRSRYPSLRSTARDETKASYIGDFLSPQGRRKRR